MELGKGGGGLKGGGAYCSTFGGSSWYSDVDIPNSAGAGASPLCPRSSALLRPAALTRTRTQSSDGRVGLG